MIRTEPPLADPTEPHVVRSPSKRSTSGADENVVDLLKQLAGQGSHLAEQQLALIKSEIRESTAEVKSAVAGMAGAAVVGLAGMAVLLMGIAYLLGDAIDNLGLATLIVGLAALGLAYVLYHMGVSKIRATNLQPERTERTLQRTPDAVRGNLSTENAR